MWYQVVLFQIVQDFVECFWHSNMTPAGPSEYLSWRNGRKNLKCWPGFQIPWNQFTDQRAFWSISEHFSFSFFCFLTKCFSQSGIAVMMVAISDMSEVKMGQLYFNGCQIRQALKVVLSSIRARKDHTKRYAVKSKGYRSSCPRGFLKR